MRTKRPLTVWFLMVVFAWSLFSTVRNLAAGEALLDLALFDAIGRGWLLTGSMAIVAVLDAASLYFLFRPQPVGFMTCFAAIVLPAVVTMIGFSIAQALPDLLVDGIRELRSAQGSTTSPDVAAMVSSPRVLILLSSASLAFSVFLAVLVVVNRRYFDSRGGLVEGASPSRQPQP